MKIEGKPKTGDLGRLNVQSRALFDAVMPENRKCHKIFNVEEMVKVDRSDKLF